MEGSAGYLNRNCRCVVTGTEDSAQLYMAPMADRTQRERGKRHRRKGRNINFKMLTMHPLC